jgi:predicted NAD-dependent protein-ADP-ribosyltransferase YbiA (DUF1768 family)
LRQLGRSVPGLKSSEWNGVKERFMRAFIRESFAANPSAKSELLATGNATITHVNDKGEYRTLFPKVLMEVRSDFQKNTDYLDEMDKQGEDIKKHCKGEQI